jgi:hypothetical protein
VRGLKQTARVESVRGSQPLPDRAEGEQPSPPVDSGLSGIAEHQAPAGSLSRVTNARLCADHAMTIHIFHFFQVNKTSHNGNAIRLW